MATKLNIDAERVAFEANETAKLEKEGNYGSIAAHFRRASDGDYADRFKQNRWIGWQARASQAPAPAPLNESAKCSPMETLCFRCNNRIGACDQTFAAPAPAASIDTPEFQTLLPDDLSNFRRNEIVAFIDAHCARIASQLASGKDAARLDYLNRFAVITGPGQTIRDAIDAAMKGKK